ncbi:MAG: heavy metal translocating P-type ATPase [Lachnospiraceae bacterium]|nr:heavy metal translocating P-type ATPase [Lachnospiraceae bacterium]
MTKKQKKVLVRIILASALLIALMLAERMTHLPTLVWFLLYLIPYLVIGYDILKKAAIGIRNRQVFDENFLMAVATVGAILLGLFTDGSEGGFEEGVAVMLFYQIGELFQSVAVGKSRRNITALMDIRPDCAYVPNQDGGLEEMDPDDVEIGTIIVVSPGEKVPIDGIVEEGSSTLNTAALTGESLPREISAGDEIISGCINLTGVLRIRTTKAFGESTVSKILDLVENSSMKKSKSENFISKFARYYTPAVCYAALALAVVPPVALLLLGRPAQVTTWIIRALTFLVISCPCALVISIPLSFFAGIGAASSRGILVKGSNYLEAMSETSVVVFDKTGTLTKGVFEVTAIRPAGQFAKRRTADGKDPSGELLALAACAESYSNHPISKSLKEAYLADRPEAEGSLRTLASDVEEISGRGVKATVSGHTVAAGNAKMMEELALTGEDTPQQPPESGTVVHVAVDGTYAGYILISDVEKESSASALKALKKSGIERTVMLTGDNEKTAAAVAWGLGIDEYHAELLPGDKVDQVERLLAEKPAGSKLAFVGDGINDAPVLSRADIGIAMGAMGSDAAIEAADVVLMDDNPERIALAMQISRKCLRIVHENIYFALGVKGLCLILGALGIANMWVAVFADVGVMILAVCNAIRCLSVRE